MFLGLLLLGILAHPALADCLHRDVFGNCLETRSLASAMDLSLSGKKLQEEILQRTPEQKSQAPFLYSPILLGLDLPENRLIRRP